MSKLRRKLIREGDYVAEVEVELIESEEGWSPYLSLEDTDKLDRIREALRRGDVEAAGRLAWVFRLVLVSEHPRSRNSRCNDGGRG